MVGRGPMRALLLAASLLAAHAGVITQRKFSSHQNTHSRSFQAQEVDEIPDHNHIEYDGELGDHVVSLFTLDDKAITNVECSDDHSNIRITHSGGIDLEEGQILVSQKWCQRYLDGKIFSMQKVVSFSSPEAGTVVIETEAQTLTDVFENLSLTMHHNAEGHHMPETAGQGELIHDQEKTAEDYANQMDEVTDEELDLIALEADEEEEEEEEELRATDSALVALEEAEVDEDLTQEVDGWFKKKKKKRSSKKKKKRGIFKRIKKAVKKVVKKAASAVKKGWKAVKNTVKTVAKALTGNVQFNKQFSLLKFSWNAAKADKQIYKATGVDIKCVGCYAYFEGLWAKLKIDIKKFKVRDGSGVLAGTGAGSNFDIRAILTKNGGKQKDVTIAKLINKKVIMLNLGVVQVPLIVDAPLMGGYKTFLRSNLEAQVVVQAGFKLRLGFQKTAGKWGPVKTFSKHFKLDANMQGQAYASVQAWVGPKLQVTVADIFGVATGVFPWGEAGVQAAIAAQRGQRVAGNCQLWIALGLEIPFEGVIGFPGMKKKKLPMKGISKTFLNKTISCKPKGFAPLSLAPAPARQGGGMISPAAKHLSPLAPTPLPPSLKNIVTKIKDGQTAPMIFNAMKKDLVARLGAKNAAIVQDVLKKDIDGVVKALIPKVLGELLKKATASRTRGFAAQGGASDDGADQGTETSPDNKLVADCPACGVEGSCLHGKCMCNEGWKGTLCEDKDESNQVLQCPHQCSVLTDRHINYCTHLIGQPTCVDWNEIETLDRLAYTRAKKMTDGTHCQLSALNMQCQLLLPTCEKDNSVAPMCLEDCTELHDHCDFGNHANNVHTCLADATSTRKMTSRFAGGPSCKKTTFRPAGKCVMPKEDELAACQHMNGKPLMLYTNYFDTLEDADDFVLAQTANSTETGSCMYSEIASLCHSFLPECEREGDEESLGMCQDSCTEVMGPCTEMSGDDVNSFCHNANETTSHFVAGKGKKCSKVSMATLKNETELQQLETLNRAANPQPEAAKTTTAQPASSQAWVLFTGIGVGVVLGGLMAAVFVVLNVRRTRSSSPVPEVQELESDIVTRMLEPEAQEC